LSIDSSNLPLSNKASTAHYTALERKSLQLINNAKQITQFGDRDSDPGFISNVVEPGLSQWMQNQDTSGALSAIQSQRAQYFTS
jgi:multiple sugar transport system substrate-binding protein